MLNFHSMKGGITLRRDPSLIYWWQVSVIPSVLFLSSLSYNCALALPCRDPEYLKWGHSAIRRVGRFNGLHFVFKRTTHKIPGSKPPLNQYHNYTILQWKFILTGQMFTFLGMKVVTCKRRLKGGGDITCMVPNRPIPSHRTLHACRVNILGHWNSGIPLYFSFHCSRRNAGREKTDAFLVLEVYFLTPSWECQSTLWPKNLCFA